MTAAAVGTRGAFYAHFPDREQLFLAVLEDVGGAAECRTRTAGDPAGDPLNDLRAVLLAFLDIVVEAPDVQALLVDGPAVFGPARWHQAEQARGLVPIEQRITAAIAAGVIAEQPVRLPRDDPADVGQRHRADDRGRRGPDGGPPRRGSGTGAIDFGVAHPSLIELERPAQRGHLHGIQPKADLPVRQGRRRSRDTCRGTHAVRSQRRPHQPQRVVDRLSRSGSSSEHVINAGGNPVRSASAAGTAASAGSVSGVLPRARGPATTASGGQSAAPR